MKVFKPPKRLVELGLVLQYDKEHQPIFNLVERIYINQERGLVMQKNNTYEQPETIETKIQKVLIEIKVNRWKPEKEIQYVYHYQ